ncbi:TMEM175 family protein [Lysobacter korlensis]|uniref:TMEM175 family protein n=1 Tax=Lysobacter korlensis TaxID=553636 RepID=A0ABV6RZL6_9GAMM
MIDRDENPLEFGRVLSLSDAVFGLAMTLLVVSIAIPPGLSSPVFTQAVVDLLPRVAIMALSFAVAASAWLEHRRLFGRLQRIDSSLQRRNFLLLGLVALIPLPHQILGSYPQEPLSYVLYATVLAAVNAVMVWLAVHARRRNLLRRREADAHRLEIARGVLDIVVFGLSIPLAFLLVGWTPLVWVALLPLEVLLRRRMRRRYATRGDSR